MKYLILGAYGMIGHKLVFYFSAKKYEIYATCRVKNEKYTALNNLLKENLHSNIEADNFSSLTSIIDKIQPDCIINCIGLIKQRKEGTAIIPNLLINALFPHNLADYCISKNIKLIHFSTDCVFSGKCGNYIETDYADADDYYGRTKYLGEINENGCMTIRSSVIGNELNSKYGLYEWFLNQKGNRIKGFKKVIYSGFTTLEMCRIIELTLTQISELSGVWHIASNPISKYDLLCKINDKLGLNIEIIPDEKIICDRSLNGSLFNKKTGYSPPSWEKMINELINDKVFYENIKKV